MGLVLKVNPKTFNYACSQHCYAFVVHIAHVKAALTHTICDLLYLLFGEAHADTFSGAENTARPVFLSRRTIRPACSLVRRRRPNCLL